MTVSDAVSVAHQVRGRLRLRPRGRANQQLLTALELCLGGAEGVQRVRINETAASIVVEYDPLLQSTDGLLALPLESDLAPINLQARIDESALVRAAPAAVWAVLGEPERAAAHLPSVLKIRDEAEGVWQVTLELLGQRLQGRVRLAETVPDERLVLAIDGAVEGRYILSLAPEAGGTRVREQVAYDLGAALLSRALGRLAEPSIRRLVREHLASIDRLVASARNEGPRTESDGRRSPRGARSSHA